MNFFFFVFKLVLYTFIFSGISNSSYSKVLNFNQDAKNISNYFSGLITFDNFDYLGSEKFFNKLSKSEKNNQKFSSKFIQSLVNLEKFDESYSYSKKIDKQNISNFEANLIQGLFNFKNRNYIKAKFYFNKLEPTFEHQLIFEPLQISLKNWSDISLSDSKESIKLIKSMPTEYGTFKLIQETFVHCYFDTHVVEKEFKKILQSEKNNFYRYNFFFANHLIEKGKFEEAKRIINLTSKKFPRNLLINQLGENLKNGKKNKNEFTCKETQDILAEILYAFANALSTQQSYKLSNFYISLSKFLNPNFLSYDALLAENFVMLEKYNKAEKIYKKLSRTGSFYEWHSSKAIASILDEQNKKEEAINYFSQVYKKINKTIFRTFDFANFLRTMEKYEKSIELYSKILNKVNENHSLYPKVLDRRGTAYERIGKWELAEKDLLLSLKILPDQAYTINYLAYSWIEKEKNTEKALTMLKKANSLKRNDGYITDSLGWALYKLNNFSEAEMYLERAITIMPQDPIINDHFADCLWMNDKKIQARYYWKYVLTLEDTEKELRQKIENKLLFGLEKS